MQVLAALLGLALGVFLVRGLRRGLAQAIIPVQLFAIPILGLAFFVLNPAPPEPLPGLIWVLIATLIFTLAGLPLWLRWHARQMDTTVKTPAMLAIHTRAGVVFVACTVLTVSTYLFVFEPLFAGVNMIAYLVWVLVWIPKGLRKRSAEVSNDLAASPSRVWEYLIDVSKWPSYSNDLEDVKASPPGPLEVGSRITLRRRPVPVSGSPAKTPQLSMEFQSVVTEMVPPTSYTVVALDRAAITKTAVTSALAGSHVTRHTQFVLSIADGIAGQAFRWPAAVAQFKATQTRSFERLNELLSS